MTVRGFALLINGQLQTVVAEGSIPLLHVLRADFGLIGTRFGCGAGQCGTCHVLLDGVSVAACVTPLEAVEGRCLTTVEGLQVDGQLHPLQQAFVDEQAAQCGYCISGILVTATAFLKNVPNPTEHQVRQALDGHLCRCGSHNRIVRAVLRAAKAMQVNA